MNGGDVMFEKISRLCNERGISIWKLENVLGFGRGTIFKWKKSSPSVEKLKTVADYFGVTLDYLLTKE